MPDRDPLTRDDRAAGVPVPRANRNGCLIIVGSVIAAALISLAVLFLLIWRNTLTVTHDAQRMAASVAESFQRTVNFTPEIRVNSTVIVAASKPVLELVTLQKQSRVRHAWTHTWLHSTKALEIEATFTARAGFDLTDSFVVQIDPATRALSADMPSPKILSLSMSDVRILKDEDGLWNKLTAEDREKAIAELETRASAQFKSSSLLAEAKLEAEKRLREILDDAGKNLRIEIENSPPKN